MPIPDGAEDLLSNIGIATPCTADWSQMSGDDKTRFCQECKLNVHNLSAMTAEEAAGLLKKKEDGQRLCLSFFMRADGTVITQDCPVGLRLLREKASRAWQKVASFVSAFIWLTLSVQASPQANNKDTGKTTSVKISPVSAQGRISLKEGTDAYDKKQYQTARAFFQKISANDPGNDEARYHLALSMQALHEMDAALEQYKILANRAKAKDIKAAAAENVRLLSNSCSVSVQAPNPVPPAYRIKGGFSWQDHERLRRRQTNDQ